MRQLSDDFQNHIEGEVTTLCTCWIITTVKGDNLGFTDHDETIELLGVTCDQFSGMESSQVEERLGLTVSTTEVSGALSSHKVTEEAISSGYFDRAKISTYLVNWSSPDQFILDRTHIVGKITRLDGASDVACLEI